MSDDELKVLFATTAIPLVKGFVPPGSIPTTKNSEELDHVKPPSQMYTRHWECRLLLRVRCWWICYLKFQNHLADSWSPVLNSRSRNSRSKSHHRSRRRSPPSRNVQLCLCHLFQRQSLAADSRERKELAVWRRRNSVMRVPLPTRSSNSMMLPLAAMPLLKPPRANANVADCAGPERTTQPRLSDPME